MFSKKLLWLKHIFFVFFLLLFSMGCGLNLSEKKEPQKPLKVNSQGFSCLNKMGEKVDAFLNAQLSSDGTKEFYDCLENSFYLFQKYTKGANDSYYTPEELRSFLQNDLIRSRQISDELLLSAMQLKQAVIGGPVDRITREDLNRLVKLLQVLKKGSMDVQPHIQAFHLTPFISQESLFDEYLKKRKDAKNVMTHSVRNFGVEVGNTAQPYSLLHMENFFVQLTQYMYGDDTKIDSIKKWIELLVVSKPILVGGSRDLLEPEKWGEFLSSNLEWYLLYLQYKQENLHFHLFDGLGFLNFNKNVQTFFDLTRQSIYHHPNQTLPFKELERLFGVLQKLEFVSNGISSQKIFRFLPNLINKIFGDRYKKPSQRIGEGVTEKILDEMAIEFKGWSSIQSYLNRYLSPDSTKKEKDLPARQENKYTYTQQQELKKIRNDLGLNLGGDKMFFNSSYLDASGSNGDSLNGGLSNSEYNNEYKILKMVRPFFMPGEERVYLTYADELNDSNIQRFYNFSIMNVMRAMMRLLVRGYAEDSQRSFSMGGLTQNELPSFFRDIKTIGEDMGFMDPQNSPEDLGQRVYVEGNVFTYFGDGGSGNILDLLDFGEGVELFSLVFSGYNLSHDMYKQALLSCETGPKDLHGKLKIRRDCFAQLFQEKMIDWLNQLPQMKKYWKDLSLVDKRLFFRILSRVAVRPIQKEIDYIKATQNILGDTKPFKLCSSPSLVARVKFWDSQAREEFESCQLNNSKREEALLRSMDALKSINMLPLSCEWLENKKEVSHHYCDWMEEGEMAMVAVLLHYIETVLTRFDVNSNGHIDDGEADKAFPVFRGLIEKIVKEKGYQLGEERLKQVYRFTLSHFLIPTKKDLYWDFSWTGYQYDINLDRLGLLKIFELIVNGEKTPLSVPMELDKIRGFKKVEETFDESKIYEFGP